MQSVSFEGISGLRGPQAPNHDAFKDLNLDTFIQLLVAELQNQDPLSPMSNTEILQQVSQIRAIESNARLTSTLEAVLLGQNVATASSLLGRTVTGLSDESGKVTGKVDRVTIADGVTKLHVGDNTLSLKNVSEILPASGTTGP
ncbi:MAG: flagellar hook assembly protein FlgD [Thermoguttaceae bacterium]